MTSANPVIALLTYARRSAGVSQRAVAAAMGTGQSSISELETGATADPQWSTLVRYAEAVGVVLDVTVRSLATPASAGEPEVTPKDLQQEGSNPQLSVEDR